MMRGNHNRLGKTTEPKLRGTTTTQHPLFGNDSVRSRCAPLTDSSSLTGTTVDEMQIHVLTALDIQLACACLKDAVARPSRLDTFRFESELTRAILEG